MGDLAVNHKPGEVRQPARDAVFLAGETPDWQRLIELRGTYRMGSVPPGGQLLVGGADAQKDRIVASFWAFGRGKQA